jgi:dTDP-4-dehydrorhamnose reductase
MRALVLGASGLFGSNVLAVGRKRGHEIVGTYSSSAPGFDGPLERLDIRADETRGRLMTEHNPDVVFNCAAMTDVDACESDPERAFAVNAEAPGALAAQCADHGASVVHVSTDYVFDGTAERPYRETDQPNPKQVYGKAKLAGERLVQEAHPESPVSRLVVTGSGGVTR